MILETLFFILLLCIIITINTNEIQIHKKKYTNNHTITQTLIRIYYDTYYKNDKYT